MNYAEALDAFFKSLAPHVSGTRNLPSVGFKNACCVSLHGEPQLWIVSSSWKEQQTSHPCRSLHVFGSVEAAERFSASGFNFEPLFWVCTNMICMSGTLAEKNRLWRESMWACYGGGSSLGNFYPTAPYAQKIVDFHQALLKILPDAVPLEIQESK